MLNYLKHKLKFVLGENEKSDNYETKTPITHSVDENMIVLRSLYSNTMDLTTRQIIIGKTKIQFVICEGLVDSQKLAIMLVNPLMRYAENNEVTSQNLKDYFEKQSVMSIDQKIVYDFEELIRFLGLGFVGVFIEGQNTAFALAMQGFSYRSISEPSNEVNELGSKEAFTEPIKINISLVRRRLKSPNLHCEMMTVGKKSKTDICLIYMNDRVSEKLLSDVKKRINNINLDIVLDSNYIRPFLEKNPYSLISSVGNTERPDVLCGKVNEGRIAILVDGSPFALIVPYLFSEYFRSFDDYVHKPYFSSLIRILKYFSFYISFLLPGGYVAVSSFHPELLPSALLYNIAAAEEITPFSLMVEALFIYLVFEIMREAGIRLPNAVGHTIGIVGALVIGDAAVEAGLIGAPMVMVVAITAICAFAISSLYEPIMLLRFVFIILGGTLGLLGIALGIVIVSAIICSMNSFNVPMTAPLSPTDLRWINDGIIFTGLKKLSKSKLRIQNINGSEIKDKGR